MPPSSVVNQLKKMNALENTLIMNGFFDRIIGIATLRIDIGNCMTNGTGNSGVRSAIVEHIPSTEVIIEKEHPKRQFDPGFRP